jgi:hypothetical protein
MEYLFIGEQTHQSGKEKNRSSPCYPAVNLYHNFRFLYQSSP